MKILSVDDVMLIRKITGRVVEALGGELLEASNGLEALLALEKAGGNIDLIILDWNMPKMDGFEFLKKIKGQEKYSHIPVMMATTEAEKEKIVKAIQAGAKNYLIKPFTDQELTRKILDCLGLGYEFGILNRCFSDAVVSVISSASGLAVAEKYEPPAETPDERGYVSGLLVLLGQINAVACLSMARESAAGMAARKAGKKPPELSVGELLDGISSMLREVANKAGKMLADVNLQLNIAAPFVSAGIVEEERHIPQKKVFTIMKTFFAGEMKISFKMYYL